MKEQFKSSKANEVPVGTIVASILSEANINTLTGWLLCNGSEVPKNLPLYKLYGVENTPNLEGRTLIGTSSNYRLLDTGGEETHTLTKEEMPSHNHELRYPQADNNEQGWPANGFLAVYGTDRLSEQGSGPMLEIGGDQPHNIMQPYCTVNYIIYAGIE